MANTKKSAFYKLLTRDNDKVQKARAEKLDKITSSEADAYINNLENKKMQIEDQLDTQLDITTSNDLTSANAIKEWNGEKFIKKRVELELELVNLNMNLEAANKVKEDLFG